MSTETRGRHGVCLDLRRYHLGELQIASYARKAEALACMKLRAKTHPEHGLKASYVTKAANRFNVFWVVAWPSEEGRVVLLMRNGESLTVSHPGWVRPENGNAPW